MKCAPIFPVIFFQINTFSRVNEILFKFSHLYIQFIQNQPGSLLHFRYYIYSFVRNCLNSECFIDVSSLVESGLKFTISRSVMFKNYCIAPLSKTSLSHLLLLTTLHSPLLSTTVHFSPLLSVTLHYSTLLCTTLHFSSVISTTLHYPPLLSTSVHYCPLLSTTLHFYPLFSITLHYSTYTSLHYCPLIFPTYTFLLYSPLLSTT